MKQILGLLFGLLVVTPLPGLAKNLTAYNGSGTATNVYISNDVYLIHLTANGSDITGAVWTGSGWSGAETIFTDSGEDFNLYYNYDLAELSNGTIVVRQDEDLVSYSEDYGFQHTTLVDSGTLDEMVVLDESVSFVYCTVDEDPSAVSWSEATGLASAVTLAGGVCTDDLSYMTGQKDVLLDYYSGTAYDISNNYAVLDTIDLSGLDYAGEDDDYDSQGHDPHVYEQKNGDVVFAFDDSLYGYSYEAQTWQPIVTLSSGFELIGAGSDANEEEYDYPVQQSPNGKRLFAFASNAADTEFKIYRWKESGWDLEKSYSFDGDAELILTTTDKSKKSLDWALWLPDNNTLNVYRWSKKYRYHTLTTRDLECDAQCTFTLDISKKGKVFFTWNNDPALSAGVWTSDTDTWEDTTLVADSSNDDGVVLQSKVTSLGQWIVEYEGEKHSVKRWTPDTSWGATHNLTSEGSYYNDDKLYLVGLDSYVLTVRQFSFDDGSKTAIASIDNVSSFNATSSFIYNDGLFLYYATRDGERVMDKVAL